MKGSLKGVPKKHLFANDFTAPYTVSVSAITHRIDPKLKKKLDAFCKEHGLKAQAVVQEAIAVWLEDAEDVALIEERREGPWVGWDEVKKDL